MRIFHIVLALMFFCFYTELTIAGTISSFKTDNATYILREPRAWGAIYKYCLACHGAAAIDKANFVPSIWQNCVDKCMLHMHSRGYPRPTKADREALYNFLPLVTPIDRKPPVYMVKPRRGSLAVP